MTHERSRLRLRAAALTAVLAAATAVVAGIGLIHPAGATAASVDPVYVSGNPTCTSLGYDFGFKVDPPTAGTYEIMPGKTVTVATDGVYFDWTSQLGIDAVISKGGPNSNEYVYDPPAESFGDTGLHSPINAANGNPYGLSHIEFCYDVELEVTKTATTTFTRTYDWTIDKSVSPATWNLFSGDTGTSVYTVSVAKSGYTDSGWAVSGQISVHNPAPVPATVTGVTDTISGGVAADVSCGVTFPYQLGAGQTLTCSYSAALPDGSARTNTAAASATGIVKGGTGTAGVSFGSPTTLVNDSVTVTDSFAGSLGSFTAGGSATYSRTFACDADEGRHDNTATIVETGQSDSASVSVNCYEPTVTKTANTSLTRTWTWTIDKVGDQARLLLSPGQLFTVNYGVTVDATSVDSLWGVAGEIVVQNPNPDRAATLTGVTDLVSTDIAASVTCPSLTVPAGGSITCTYTAGLPDASSRTNTATAVLQNHAYDAQGVGTPSGTSSYTGSAAVSFDSPAVSEVDECITVTDTDGGALGTVCASDAPQTFQFAVTFGQHPDAFVQLGCGETSHVDTASFVTNDTAATGDDSWTVTATVVCETGCTLTPGYWKTHSQEGPAPYDEAWLNLGPSQEDTPFFLSGMTYYEALWTPPAGNVYYILAHAYIAAQLNKLDGASMPAAVLAELATATNLFATYTPAQAATLKGGAKTAWTYAAKVLDEYNNGIRGPGHCSE